MPFATAPPLQLRMTSGVNGDSRCVRLRAGQCQGLFWVRDGAYEDHTGARAGHLGPHPQAPDRLLEFQGGLETQNFKRQFQGRFFPRGFGKE